MLYRSFFALFAFLSLTLTLPLFAEDAIDSLASSSLTSTEGSIIAGHVSVISGDFLIHDEDMALPGPDSLRLKRNYCSSDPYGIFLAKSWNLVEPLVKEQVTLH